MQLETIFASLKDMFVKTVRQEVNDAIEAHPSKQGINRSELNQAVAEALSNQDKNTYPSMNDVVTRIENDFSEWFDNCLSDVDWDYRLDINEKVYDQIDNIDWDDKVNDVLYQNDIPNEARVVEQIEEYLKVNEAPAPKGALTLAVLGELLLKAADTVEETMTTKTADTKEV